MLHALGGGNCKPAFDSCGTKETGELQTGGGIIVAMDLSSFRDQILSCVPVQQKGRCKDDGTDCKEGNHMPKIWP